MKKYIFSFGMLMLAAGMMTACSTKQDVNVSEELSSIEEESGQPSGGSGLVKLLGVTEDKITYDASGLSGNVCVVNADVDVPDAAHAAIFHQEQKQMTAGAVKDLAAGLFQKDSCQAVKPFAAYTEKELREVKEDLKNQILDIREQARKEGQSDWMAASRKEDYKYMDVQVLLEAYDDEPQAWKEDEFYVRKDGSRILIYQGLIDDETYFFVAVTDEQGSQIKMNLYKEEEPWAQAPSWFGFSYGERNIDELNDTLYGKNQCTLSLEEARQMAETFLERYGLVNMQMVDVKDAVPSTKTFVAFTEETDSDYEDNLNSDIPIGYSFHFVRCYEGVPTEYTGNLETVLVETEDENKLGDECYQVVVTSEGIACVSIGALYDVTEALTEQSTLLTFEQINNIARELLPTLNYTDEVNRIEFCYKNVKYDGQIVLMPVWIYSHCIESDAWSGETRINLLILNAVDGSEIYGARG